MATIETDRLTEIVNSNVPINWVTLEQFGNIIGYPHARLYNAKAKMPEGKVWQKVNGKIYFSVEGFNSWLDEQAIQKALEYEATASKLTSPSMANAITLPSRNHPRRKALAKRESYELT